MVRLTDERRGSARRTGLSDTSDSDAQSDSSSNNSSTSSDSNSGAESDDALPSVPKLSKGRHSIRQSFMSKVLSPVIGYAEEYELLHFVYDLCMWSGLGGCKNATRGIPLRLAMKGASFTPGYWKVRHLGLIDMQRQCGHAALFRTRAPYEKSFPYHQWVLDEMAKAGRGRQNLAGLETLHMAHVLKEMSRGYFTGLNKRNTTRPGQKWKEHLLGAEDEESAPTVLNSFGRLEFQDGKRKRCTQKYHGRGTVHEHAVDYLSDAKRVKLEDKIAATIPPETEPFLRGLVLDGQQDLICIHSWEFNIKQNTVDNYAKL